MLNVLEVLEFSKFFVIIDLQIVYESLFRSSFGYLLNDINNILICLNSSTSFIFYCKYSTR